MQELDIKRGHFKKIDGGKLEELMTSYFGGVEKEGDWLVSNFGAMWPIKVRVEGKNLLLVEIETKKDVDDATAMKSIKARNNFLQDATGFTSKERGKRLQKKAKEGKL